MDIDVELVTKIISEKLAPAVEAEGRRIEDNLQASYVAFQQDVRREVELHHSENRLRFQFQDATLARVEATNSRIEQQAIDNGDLTRTLIGEVREFAGKREGIQATEDKFEKRANEKREKRSTWFKWLVTAAASTGVLKWLSDHFHWGGK